MGLGNQLIIILRVDKELRVICGIRVLIKTTDCTDYTVFRILIKSLNTNILDLTNGVG